MARHRFDRKRGGLKRSSNAENLRTSGNAKKKRRTAFKEEVNQSSSPSDSGVSYDEPENIVSEEEAADVDIPVVYREPTMYDSLLKALGSQNESVAHALERRQREEQGRSDSEEDVDGDSESSSVSDELDNEDDDSVRGLNVGNRANRAISVESAKLHKDIGTDDDDDDDARTSETDDELNDQSISDASVSRSSFDNHFGCKISNEDIDNLLRRKWSYMWKMPALNMSNCNWRGTGACFVDDSDMNSCYGLKPRLYKHLLETYKAFGGSDFDASKRRMFFSVCNSYRDILYHNKKPFYLKGSDEDSSIMDAYLMHSLNHILRSIDLVVKNNKKLDKHQETDAGEIPNDDAFLDRGFTRPKVLVLLPLAGIARRVVKRLIQLTPSMSKAKVENFDRFCDEFGAARAEEDDEDDAENYRPKKSSKPQDFQLLLGDNDNDCFVIGIKFSRTLKLYSDFYTSDMIVASPLGLVSKIWEAEKDKEKDVDYLSSIEILIIDHADIMLMQNWSHVNTVVEQLNQLPSKHQKTDIMRIRQWYLDGQAQFYRQTILLSSHINPDINALFNQQCLNYEGKVRMECKYKGVLPKILLQIRQIYERFEAESLVDADEARFEYFSRKVFPKIKDSVQGGTMLFISSYFEFVRLRNFLKSQEASFCAFGEYIKRNNISRVRGEFFTGRKKIMLYTERAHFYYRYKIRGVKNLIIYSLPERKEFYSEIVNLLEESSGMSCTVLFSRFDHLRLERIVGSAAAKRMVNANKGIFVFS